MICRALSFVGFLFIFHFARASCESFATHPDYSTMTVQAQRTLGNLFREFAATQFHGAKSGRHYRFTASFSKSRESQATFRVRLVDDADKDYGYAAAEIEWNGNLAGQSLKFSAQGEGAGTLVYRNYLRATNVDTTLVVPSTNRPTTDFLTALAQTILREADYLAIEARDADAAHMYLDKELSERSNQLYERGEKTALWIALLRKAGWKNVRVETTGFAPVWSFDFHASKRE